VFRELILDGGARVSARPGWPVYLERAEAATAIGQTSSEATNNSGSKKLFIRSVCTLMGLNGKWARSVCGGYNMFHAVRLA
jgi:hypothetical protein